MGRKTQERMIAWGAGIGLMLAIFALYAPSIGYEFINWDDIQYLGDNPVVSGGISREGLKAAWSTAPESMWAPLLWMSFMLDVELFGLEPWGFHLVNVLLFCLNAGLVYALVRRWTGRTGVALAVAALWAFHPARVESVAWVAERKDVLSGLFFLLGLGAYARGGAGARVWGGWTWVSAGFLVLGMLSKPVVVMAPFVLILLDIWPLGRLSWEGEGRGRAWWGLIAEKWPYGFVAFGLGAISWWAGPATPQPSWAYRLAMIPINYLSYLREAMWPAGLTVLCPRPAFSYMMLALSLAVLGGGTAWTWRGRRRSPVLLVGWLWFGLLLVPSIGFFWFGTTEGNGVRFSYLPQIGLMLGGVLGVDGMLRRQGWNWRWGAAAGMIMAGIWAAGTIRLLPHWRNSQTVFTRALELNPDNVNALDALGNAWIREGRLADWQEYMESLRREQPGKHMVDIYYAWWQAAMLGDSTGSVSALEDLTGLDSTQPGFWTWLETRTNGEQLLGMWRDMAGICLRSQGDWKQMEQLRCQWERSLDLRTRENFLAEMLLAYGAAGLGAQAEKVERELQGAVETGNWTQTILDRLFVRWRQGARGYAYSGFLEVAQWRPEDGMALNNMAWLVATAEPDGLNHARQAEWPATAVAWAERAVESGGQEFAGAWDTLAAARANAGDFPGAVAAAERAMELAQRAGDWTLTAKVQTRLAEYRAGLPWREEDERSKKDKGR